MKTIYELTDDLRGTLKRLLGDDLISVEAIDSTFGQKQVVVRLKPQGALSLQNSLPDQRNGR